MLNRQLVYNIYHFISLSTFFTILNSQLVYKRFEMKYQFGAALKLGSHYIVDLSYLLMFNFTSHSALSKIYKSVLEYRGGSSIVVRGAIKETNEGGQIF